MTIESLKLLGPVVSRPFFSAAIDTIAADVESMLNELISASKGSDYHSLSGALLAILAYSKGGWDSVRVGFGDAFATSTHALLDFVSSRVAFRNSANSAYVGIRCASIALDGAGVTISIGTGTPEGAVSAVVSSLFLRTDGGASTSLYVKESGSGNTGWVAK